MFNILPPYLEVKDGVVKISRISPRVMKRDFKRLFQSVRLSNNLFIEHTISTVSFYEFFSLEFYYSLEKLLVLENASTSKGRIRQLMRCLKEGTWLKRIDQDAVGIVNPKRASMFKFTPLEHQALFLKNFNDTIPRYGLRGMLLAAEPGTGKTYTALLLGECLDCDMIVVICPLNAVETVWKKSTVGKDSLYNKDPSVWIVGSSTKYTGERIIICHYEAIDKLLAMRTGIAAKKVLVALDESHNLNELKSLRTRLFLELCQDLNAMVVLATGTPIKALAYETIPLLRAIDPLFTEEVERIYSRMFAGEASKLSEILSRRLNIISHRVSGSVLRLQEPIITEIKVVSLNAQKYTLPAIREDMQKYASERKAEILSKMSSYVSQHKEFVDFSQKEHAASKSYSAEMREEIERGFSEYRQNVLDIKNAHDSGQLRSVLHLLPVCSKFEREYIIPCLHSKQDRELFKFVTVCTKYYTLKIQGECLGRVLGRKRTEAYLDLISSIDFEEIVETSEKKTLIFTSFVEVVKSCEAALKQLGYKPLVMYGDFTKDLKSTVDKFETDESANPLIATYNALSTAVPLVMADTLIAINPPYRDYVMKQAIARIRRIGTTTQTRVYNVTLDTGAVPNICDRMLDIIKWSKEQSNAILNINDEVHNDELEISMENVHVHDFIAEKPLSLVELW